MLNKKNIISSLLSTFLVVGIIYAANNYVLNSGDAIDYTTWNNLGEEVTSLRAELDALKTSKANVSDVYTKTEADSIFATAIGSSDGKLTQVGSLAMSSSNWYTWDLEVEKDKPLYIGLDGSGSSGNSLVVLKVTAGSTVGRANNASFMLGGRTESGGTYNSTDSFLVVPESTTVTISTKQQNYQSGRTVVLYAYQ